MNHHRVILTAICLLLPAIVRADVADSVLQIEATAPHCVPGGCVLATDQGSAVLIGDRDGLPVAVTCYHCIKSYHLAVQGTARLRLRTATANHPATLIAIWPDADLALVTAAGPGDLPEPAEIIETTSAANVELIGFPAGRFCRLKARIKARSRRGELIADQPAAQGQSGGGLFAGQQLAGIVWGTMPDSSVATSGQQVAHFARLFKVRVKVRTRGIVPPAPPPASSLVGPAPESPMQNPGADASGSPSVPGEPRNPWYPDPVLNQLKTLTDRLTAIEAKVGQPGPAGPPGPTGPPGKDAPQNNADSGQLSGLAKRLAALESRGQTVQLIDESGKVISEQTYAPGQPIKLQFNQVTK